eukprot:m51a1_g2536 putative actin binding protein e (131) ;mRNA; f:254078-254565
MDTSDPAILDALKAVFERKHKWAQLGLVPKTTRLRVDELGDMPLGELKDELSDGKVLYVYAREDLAEGPKFLLVAWCGEGAQPGLKAAFGGMTAALEEFLRRSGFAVSARLLAKNAEDIAVELGLQRWRL